MDKAVVQHCPGLISLWPANTADGYQACSLLDNFFLFVGRELCTNKVTLTPYFVMLCLSMIRLPGEAIQIHNTLYNIHMRVLSCIYRSHVP